ncbi:MAG: hypothetical protein ACTHOI_06650 [Sphingomicrobium sp.]
MNDVDLKEPRAAHARHRKPKVGRQQPTRPWQVEIDVYLDDVSPPPERKPTFHLETCLPRDPYGNIVFFNCDRPGFEIRFNLYDNTNNGQGSGYVFHPPSAPPHDVMQWAMWSSLGPDCPRRGCGQWPEFTSGNIENAGQTLVVENTNSTQAYFGYTLRVTNDHGGSFVELDPGGSNQNGSSSAYGG